MKSILVLYSSIDYVEISVLLEKFESQTQNLNMGQRGVINSNFVILNTFSSLRPGHYLGMDVHDCSTISYDRTLKPGVVSCLP